MGTPKHGRKGLLYGDTAATPTGTVSQIPMLVSWSIDGTTDDVDMTSCDDDNKVFVQGLPNFSGKFEFNMDADSDQVYAMCDGQARQIIFYPDRTAPAGKRRYNKGPVMMSINESGGVSAGLKQEVSFKAAGSVARAFV